MRPKHGFEYLQNYLDDTSNFHGKASALYIPQSQADALAFVKNLSQAKQSFTVSSGRTGTTGGCVPVSGAIISLEKLNKIVNIDSNRQVVCVEAGVTLEQLELEVNKYKLTLRAQPTESLAFVGGAVSTAASGVRGFGYGSIRDYVLGITVILSSGEIIDIKRGDIYASNRLFDFEYANRRYNFKLPSYQILKIKTQAGYYVYNNMDLIDLFIGSEGTLGMITSCLLKLQKIPFNIFDGLVFFKNENKAFNFVKDVRRMKKEGSLKVVSLEFFDKNSLNMLKEFYSFIPESDSAVYFEQEVRDDKDYDLLLEEWGVLIDKNGGLKESVIADTFQERKKIFEFRHKLPQAINEYLRQTKQVKVASDIAVPEVYFKEMYDYYKEKARAYKINYVNFGHIGECHLHFNFLPQNDKEAESAKECLRKFCRKSVSLGGTVSAEHGIGKIKKSYLKIMYSDKEIQEMADLKKYFDPGCLIGLDNIFDRELLRN